MGGPAVWLDLDQAALDAAYDQAIYAPNRQQVLARYAANSERVRARLGNPLRYAYGPSPVEGLDVFPTRRPGAPIHIFIHGGAWRLNLAKDYAYLAEAFVRAGSHFIVPNFIDVVTAGGSLLTMAEQVHRAIAWVYRNASTLHGDPERIYLSGHSSGAHLAAVALTTMWQKDFGVPANIIKGALCCSGIYDLKPVRLSARGKYVKFDDAMEHGLSPQRHIANLETPLIVAYGSLETPEFQRQSRDFATGLRNAGKRADLIVGEHYNHFEIAETMAHPYGVLGSAVLEQMSLL